ncbi:integrase core domain protein, partial [Aphelenchoides avenae]
MNAFKRFIGRRGRPDVCYSDNAATYKLAGRTIEWAWKELAWDDGFSCYLAKECIQWRFTTELAPWENGAVECMVKPVKKAYYKLVGRRILTGEELSSLLPQIEAIVNSRPLVAISDDPEAGVLPHSFSKTHEPSIADCSDAAAATCTASSAVNEGQLVIAAASDPSTTRAVRQEDAVSTQIVPSEQEEEAAEEVRQDF